MDSKFSVHVPQAFVLGPAELKKIEELLKRISEITTISAECAGNVSHTFKSVEELLKYDNYKDRRIYRVQFYSFSSDPQRRANVDFAGSKYRGISLEFEARSDVVDRLRKEILDITSEACPWYSPLYRVNFVFVMFLAYFIVVFSSIVANVMGWLPDVEIDQARVPLIVYGPFAVIFIVGFLLNYFRERIFPRAVFLIGHGKARYENLQKVQWGIVITFVISFVASVAASLVR